MDGDTIGAIIQTAFKHWGLFGLFFLALSAMGGVSIAQAIQMKRWQPQTKEIACLLRDNITVLKQIVGKLDLQHTTCTKHYEYAQRQIEGMESIGQELQAVVKSIADSDRTRNSEIMQLMTVIASRHLQ
jgi:hypothetical protein